MQDASLPSPAVVSVTLFAHYVSLPAVRRTLGPPPTCSCTPHSHALAWGKVRTTQAEPDAGPQAVHSLPVYPTAALTSMLVVVASTKRSHALQGYCCSPSKHGTASTGLVVEPGQLLLLLLLPCVALPKGATLYTSAKAAGKVSKATSAEVRNLKQWEWGVPDSAVDNIRAIWTNALGRPLSSFRVVSSGVVDSLFTSTPDLWMAYLQANGVPVRGLHWNSYW